MATWYAGANSVDSGNNTGWIFTAPPSGVTGTIAFTLDAISSTATGTVTHNGTVAVALDGITTNFTGVIGHSGTLTVQLDDVSVAMSGQHGEVDDFRLLLNDIAVQFDGTVTPAPVSVITKGGITKRTKNYKNQRDQVERDVSKAINKVLGIEEPEDHAIIEQNAPIVQQDFTRQIAKLKLNAEISALSKSIEDYESVMRQAELDDEEALLLLL